MPTLRRLAPLLERLVPPIPDPSPELEQYPTPAELALRVAQAALQAGGVDATYADLGSGTCRLAGALALLGARRIAALEADCRLTSLCRESLERLGAGEAVSVVCSYIAPRSTALRPGAVDVAVSNPPFGVQRRGADTSFVEYTLGVLRPSYAIFILKSGNIRYHERLAARHGYMAGLLWRDYIAIPASMPHHRSRVRRVRVDIVGFEPAG